MIPHSKNVAARRTFFINSINPGRRMGCKIRNAAPTRSNGAAEITVAESPCGAHVIESPISNRMPATSAKTAKTLLIHRKIAFDIYRDGALAPIWPPIRISNPASSAAVCPVSVQRRAFLKNMESRP